MIMSPIAGASSSRERLQPQVSAVGADSRVYCDSPSPGFGLNASLPWARKGPASTTPPTPHCELPTPGFVPTENLRFREESLTFKVQDTGVSEDDVKKFHCYNYPAMRKTMVRDDCCLVAV